MTLSSLSRVLARSARSSHRSPRQVGLRPSSSPSSPFPARFFFRRDIPGVPVVGFRAAPPRSPTHGGDGGRLGFVRSYLTSALRSRAAATTGAGKVGDWRFFPASWQSRRLFSDGSNKNYEKYYPKEKKEKPTEDGGDKSDSKRE